MALFILLYSTNVLRVCSLPLHFYWFLHSLHAFTRSTIRSVGFVWIASIFLPLVETKTSPNNNKQPKKKNTPINWNKKRRQPIFFSQAAMVVVFLLLLLRVCRCFTNEMLIHISKWMTTIGLSETELELTISIYIRYNGYAFLFFSCPHQMKIQFRFVLILCYVCLFFFLFAFCSLRKYPLNSFLLFSHSFALACIFIALAELISYGQIVLCTQNWNEFQFIAMHSKH